MLGGNTWALHCCIQSDVEQKYTLMNLLHLVHIEEDNYGPSLGHSGL